MSGANHFLTLLSKSEGIAQAWACGKGRRPAAEAGGDAGQEALGQIHGVGHPYDGQAGPLPHGPLKQVVQHLHANPQTYVGPPLQAGGHSSCCEP